jgi:hypothetical protein
VQYGQKFNRIALFVGLRYEPTSFEIVQEIGATKNKLREIISYHKPWFRS